MNFLASLIRLLHNAKKEGLLQLFQGIVSVTEPRPAMTKKTTASIETQTHTHTQQSTLLKHQALLPCILVT